MFAKFCFRFLRQILREKIDFEREKLSPEMIERELKREKIYRNKTLIIRGIRNKRKIKKVLRETN